MQIFVLDRNFQKLDLIEGFVSFIWTERWASIGDFELKVPYGHVNSYRLRLRNYLYIEDSGTLMQIERYEKNTQSEDGDLVTVMGRSIISILQSKIHPGYDGVLPAERIALNLVQQVCVTGTAAIDPRDVIPNLSITIPSSIEGDDIHYDTGPTEIYNEIRKLAEEHDFGIRMRFNFDTGGFLFQTYRGVDRRDQLKFSPTLGNLNNVGFLRSIEEWRNHAYVTHRDLDYITPVNAHGWGGVEGALRKAILVDASEIEDPTHDKLWRYGQAALSEYKPVNLVDGELVTNLLTYGVHYNLGDRVQVEDEIGNLNDARIVEYIWSYDQDGLQSYPTFSSEHIDD